MPSEKEVKDLIESAGGKVTDGAVLPDGSGFMTASFPLPKDHWIYGDRTCENKGFEYPPMVFRMGSKQEITIGVGSAVSSRPFPSVSLTREEMAERIRQAGKYAIRAATLKGKDMDFDPDAMLQNLVVGFLGYWTEDGLSREDSWANPPEPHPASEYGCFRELKQRWDAAVIKYRKSFQRASK